jgi:hypothetical protein
VSTTDLSGHLAFIADRFKQAGIIAVKALADLD